MTKQHQFSEYHYCANCKKYNLETLWCKEGQGEKIPKTPGCLNFEIIEQPQPIDKINPLTQEVTPENILMLLITGKRRAATEVITQYLLSTEHIHTTRTDENSEMWIYKEGIYVSQGKTYIKEFCRDKLGKTYTTTLSNEVIAKIETETYIIQEELFKNTEIEHIAVENGILNLKTKKLTDFTTTKKFFNKIPITYKPGADCPNIKAHFKAVLAKQEDVPIIQELFGYLLWKEYKIEKAFMFCGSGRNGKGKTLELMKLFLGLDNCSNIPLQHFETDNFAIGELFNKMANLGGDISSTALKETGNFKSLTGRDMVSANRKFLNRVNFVNYAKMIFCANELPRTSDKTVAFFNRWILLDFPYTFMSKEEYDNHKDKKNLKIADPDIISKLTAAEELSGLLNWALEGLQRLLINGGFSHSQTTEEVKDKWLRRSDSISAFIIDCVVEKYDAHIQKNDFRRVYSQYCKFHKLRGVSDKVIKNVLAESLGASDKRLREVGVDEMIWDGVFFNTDKVSMDDKGFYTYRSISNSPRGKNTLVTLDTLDKSDILVEDIKDE